MSNVFVNEKIKYSTQRGRLRNESPDKICKRKQESNPVGKDPAVKVHRERTAVGRFRDPRLSSGGLSMNILRAHISLHAIYTIYIATPDTTWAPPTLRDVFSSLCETTAKPGQFPFKQISRMRNSLSQLNLFGDHVQDGKIVFQ